MLLPDRDILVCIFQRGAADGLNAVVPYGDNDYYSHRSTINVPAPGNAGGAIDLDGFFGLHPALAPIKPLYDSGELALIHATGVPHGSRSHFTAQGLVERGVDDSAGPTTGWLGRHLAVSPPASSSAFRAVSISGNVAVSLFGAEEPLAISNLNDFGFEQDIIDGGYPTVLAELYRSTAPFHGPAQAALAALEELQAANLDTLLPENGAVYPNSALGNKLLQAGQIIKSSLPVEVICLDSEDWDHHENLPNYINQSLTDLAGSLSAFYTDMGTRMQGVTVLVHTEFGRRVAQNASLGADHGTGSLAYLIGGGVNGGQVISAWPGLAPENLELGEDLRITIDLRTVLAELLTRRLTGTELNSVFPGFAGPYSANVFSS
ncbi:MAG: DUF1501 domain-containing protein [Gammaproteobacteria bacterium]|nr:DUF1501 domain-containing protein [Gammaproteobacteria bacterium]